MLTLDKKHPWTVIPRGGKQALLHPITAQRQLPYCMLHKERDPQIEPCGLPEMESQKLKLGEATVARICGEEYWRGER